MNLRTQVMQGGLYLAGRTGLGFFIQFLCALLVTRTIGPTAYGLYAAVAGIQAFLVQLISGGIGVYLIRKAGDIQAVHYHQAFSFLLVISSVFAILMTLGTPLINLWVRLEGFHEVAPVFFLALPLQVIGVVPQAALERQLDFKRVALVELSNQISYLLIAVPLAFGGFGVWAPVSGALLARLISLIPLFLLTRYFPRFSWNWQTIKHMITYSAGYSSSIWVWQLRSLVNPIIVSRFLGAEYVAYISVSTALINSLSFLKNITWRLSIAAFAKIQGDRQKLAQVIMEGMQLQVLTFGPIAVIFVILSPWILSWVYGEKWLPCLIVIPFIAFGSLTNVLFNLPSSALYVLQRNWDVAKFHIMHVCLFGGSAFLLIPHYGLYGYGLAEVIAVPSYILINIYIKKAVGIIRYRESAVLYFSFALSIFIYQLGWWVTLLLILPLISKNTWQLINKLLNYKI